MDSNKIPLYVAYASPMYIWDLRHSFGSCILLLNFLILGTVVRYLPPERNVPGFGYTKEVWFSQMQKKVVAFTFSPIQNLP